MDMKLVDSEIKVMDVLWKEGDSMAKHVADVMKERYGWNVNTTYTLLKRCIKKGQWNGPIQILSAMRLLNRNRCRHRKQMNCCIRFSTARWISCLHLCWAEGI